MGGLDALAAAATGDDQKKGSSEKGQLSNGKFDGAVKRWMKAAASEKQAKTDKAEAEAEFLPAVEDERVSASIGAGTNLTTVILNGKLAISKSKRYSPVTKEALPELNEIFGENAKRFFKTRMDVSVKDEWLKSDEKAQELIDAIGAENVQKFFNIKTSVVVTDAFHTERSTNQDVAVKAKKAIDEKLVKPYKAAVKLA
jgi:CxxC motif-containing protein